MSDEVATFVQREEPEGDREEVDDLVEAPRAGRAQERFQLRQREFDRVEIRAVRREEAQARADAFDRGVHGRLFVDHEIVEDHHRAGPERRDEHLLDIGEKRGVVERAVEHRRRPEAVDPQRRDDRVRLPVAAGRIVPQPGAARTATIPPEQVGGDPRLIEEDVAGRVVERLRLPPAVPGRGDIRASLFVGVDRFFLR